MANEVKITGYVNGVKEISDKLKVFSVAYGVKQENGSYKNIFINCKAGADVAVKDGERYDVDGFLTGSFFTPEGGKEKGSLELWVKTASEISA